ncbi:MAG: MmcQ/YjbR family DNA-binding protein [Actinomycetota bacterium]
MTFEDCVRLTADLPEIEVSTSYGTPSLKVKGKSFCRMWSEREHDRDDIHDTEVLVVFCEAEEKETVLDASAGVFFETPHYEGHGAHLVRLADVAEDDLADALEHSYRLKAPKSVLNHLDP